MFFEGGKTPSKARNDYWNEGEIYWTSAKDFNSQYMDSAQDKITLLAVKEAGMKVYPKGVFLSVFRSGILQHSFPTVLTTIETTINQDLKAYQLNENIIDKLYYLHFVLVFKKYILLKASKKSVTVESINTEDFLEINISNIFTNVNKGISIIFGKFHFEYGIYSFQKIGKYSYNAFFKPKALNCSIIIIESQIRLIATLKFISEDGILIYSSI